MSIRPSSTEIPRLVPDGVLRFAFPRLGFTPCTWLTTLSRDDLTEQAGTVPAAELSEIKDSLRRRTQADGEGRPR